MNRMVGGLTSKHNGPAGAAKRLSHFAIDGLHFVGLVDVAGAAPVVFQIVHAPGSVLAGVVVLVAVAAFVPRASLRPGRRIDAEFQALAVHIFSKRLHVGEFLVRLNAVEFTAALALPRVVDVDVLPPVIDQPDGVGRSTHVGVRHLTAKMVPTVPPHGRRRR